jgi:hypothetical protein
MIETANTCTATVSELRRPVLELVPDEMADAELSIDELGARIVGMAGRLAAAMCRWLLLVAEFDARDGAGKFCLPSTGRWLTHYCGLSARTAREHVRAARVLAAHAPLIEAMGAGRISYSHLRAIARVAELGEQRLVTELVMLAEHGTVGQLEDTVRGLRTVDRNNGGSRRPVTESVSHRWREDSRFGLSATLDREHGALLLCAVDALARREKITQAEALTRMAELTLATLNASDGPAPALRGEEYAAVVIHLDAARLPAETLDPDPDPQVVVEGGSAEPPAARADRPAGRIAGGPGLPEATLERLLCTARIRTILTTTHPDDPDHPDAGEGRLRWRAGVLDVGANRRLVSAKQFRALLVRDHGCCRVPGCGSRFGLQAHHVQHWIYGGKTIMANLVLLCRAHHHAVHDNQLSIIALGHQRFRFHRADRRQLPAHSDPARLATTDAPIEDNHHHVHPTAATTGWDGTALDHDYAVACFAHRLTSTQKRSA